MQAIGIPCRKSGFTVGPDRADRPLAGKAEAIWMCLAGFILYFDIGLAPMEPLFNEHNFE